MVEELYLLASFLLMIIGKRQANIWIVFIFPPRRVDSTGPTFWSQQFLNFAGVSVLISLQSI